MRSHSRTTPSAGRRIAVIAAVNFVGLGSLTAPAIAGLPLQIEAVTAHDDRAVALGTVLALGSVAALIANPVFGALSDRTRGRFGRRRPWMAVGAVAGFGGIAGLGTADTLPAIALWWVLVQVAYNATLAAAAALLADTVPEPRRAAASGYFTAAAIAGAFPPLILATILPSRLGLVSFVMPVLALIVVAIALTLRESPVGAPSVDAPASPTARTERGGIPRAFVAVWLQRFAMQSAFSLTAAFTMYLVIDRMTGDPVTATPVATLSTLIGGLGIVVGATVA
ncbi:MAG: transporter, partial [Microbacterium sp.]|nr:transporter [Microbacterium sp.]